MKPIEPGCRAICIGPDAMGEVCDVIKRIHAGVRYTGTDGLEYISDLDGWLVDFDESYYGEYEEFFLIRIDDAEEPTKQREAETV